MKSSSLVFWFWLTRPLWVVLLALVLAVWGLHSAPTVVYLSSSLASLSFLVMLVRVSQMGIGQTKDPALSESYNHFRHLCMGLLWLDHLLCVLGSLIVWCVLRTLGWSVWTIRPDWTLDAALVVVLLHLTSMFFQLYIGRTVGWLQGVLGQYSSQTNG